MNEVKRMDIKEFRELGLLQEANRWFFHPLGLALEVTINEETGEDVLGGVWDFRDDPEGIAFADGVIDPSKADYVKNLKASKTKTRFNNLGYVIQPSN